jgi:hypothetical protein
MTAMKMKRLDYKTLARLNESSIKAGRRQHVLPERMPSPKSGPFLINHHEPHVWDGRRDIRMSVVLTATGQTSWLDVSPEEFTAIPAYEVTDVEFEAADCPGTPPPAP